MTSQAAPRATGVGQLVAALARAVDASEAEVLGRPVALSLRCEHDGDVLFLSGVAADVVELVAAALAPPDGAGSLEVAPRAWAPSPTGRVGTGPVVAPVDDGWTAEAMAAVELRGTRAGDATKRDEIAAIREALRAASERLARDLDALPPVDRLVEVAAGAPEAVAALLHDVAATRHLTGRYLLDAGDFFDDERLDQLGDGYVRLAQTWSAAATALSVASLEEAVALERTCAGWMAGAAEPPTRYAF